MARNWLRWCIFCPASVLLLIPEILHRYHLLIIWIFHKGFVNTFIDNTFISWNKRLSTTKNVSFLEFLSSWIILINVKHLNLRKVKYLAYFWPLHTKKNHKFGSSNTDRNKRPIVLTAFISVKQRLTWFICCIQKPTVLLNSADWTKWLSCSKKSSTLDYHRKSFKLYLLKSCKKPSANRFKLPDNSCLFNKFVKQQPKDWCCEGFVTV